MAESTLSLSYEDLVTMVADYAGLGRTVTGDNLLRVDEVIQAAYRQFLAPENGHRWTFLWKDYSITTVGDQWEYDLPDDFGSLTEYPTYDVQITIQHLDIVGSALIRQKRADVHEKGRPRMVAVRPKTFVTGTGQRFQLLMYPQPTGTDKIFFPYNLLIDKLSTDNYPLGGLPMAETLRVMMLAEAELVFDDTPGVHTARAERRMKAAIEADKKLAPRYLGRDLENSDAVREVARRTSATYVV